MNSIEFAPPPFIEIKPNYFYSYRYKVQRTPKVSAGGLGLWDETAHAKSYIVGASPESTENISHMMSVLLF